MVALASSFEARLADAANRIERTLDRILPRDEDAQSQLYEAMRYATLGGGKRLRPFMALAAARLFGVSETRALRVGAAIEMVHCYSLVHDDLPAMDNDDFRRGRPTVHKAFDEATAILAGDGLLTQAFDVLADPETHDDPAIRVQLIQVLARAAGPRGMVGGQMIDMLAERADLDIGGITRLQRLKTGEMFAVACVSGAILGRSDPSRRLALQGYAHDLGLAFQIADDLLDVEGRVEAIGKAVRKDADRGKATFVSILGVERARDQARMLADQAIRHLDAFDERAEDLRLAARFVVERRA